MSCYQLVVTPERLMMQNECEEFNAEDDDTAAPPRCG